jgi:hypothetical protein
LAVRSGGGVPIIARRRRVGCAAESMTSNFHDVVEWFGISIAPQ